MKVEYFLVISLLAVILSLVLIIVLHIFVLVLFLFIPIFGLLGRRHGKRKVEQGL